MIREGRNYYKLNSIFARIILFLVFLLPLIFTLSKAFFTANGFTLDLVKEAFTSTYNYKILSFTIKQSLFSAILSILIALPGALLFSKYNKIGEIKYLRETKEEVDDIGKEITNKDIQIYPNETINNIYSLVCHTNLIQNSCKMCYCDTIISNRHIFSLCPVYSRKNVMPVKHTATTLNNQSISARILWKISTTNNLNLNFLTKDFFYDILKIKIYILITKIL